MKKKILFLLHSIGENRGTEKLFSQLSTKLKDNYDIFFVAFYDIKPYQNVYGKYFFLNDNENISLIGYYKNILQFRKIIIENNIDIIIGTNDLLNIFLFISTLFLKIKKIGTIHSNPLLNFNILIKRLIIKIIYPFFYKIVCVSKTQENIMKNKFKLKNTLTIYNFFDIESELLKFNEEINKTEEKKIENKFNFIMISRLDKLKGFLPILRIFQQLNKKYKDINLIILGEGEYREIMEKIMNKNKLENIFLLGSKKNIYPYLLKSQCFLFPSLTEAFGLVLIEALLANKIIISSDCLIGPKEILNNDFDLEIKKYPYFGDYGILIESFNLEDLIKYENSLNLDLDEKEKALYLIMEDIYLNQEKYITKYANGIKRAKNFDINNIIQDWKKLLG